ncbi:MAG TPA: aldo/keto reductase [Halanaerobiales bacterium]|nr:aldo/keto reductase [Halanaerobiales bacterium]
MEETKFRQLGKTKIKVFPLGFGGIPIQRLDKRSAVKVIKEAINLGINFFDTARAYTDSEEKLGMALSDVDHKVYLSSKTKANDKIGALNDVNKSLENLNVKQIDIYHLHNISDKETYKKAVLSKDSAYEGLKEAQKMGKIKHIGITGHSIQLLKKALKTNKFSVTMFCYNFIEDECEDSFLKFCNQRNIGMIVMKPFAGGRLDNANINLKYLLKNPNIIPIPGMEKIEEVRENVRIAKGNYKLSKTENKIMNDLKKSLNNKFCRRCGYCLPCPEGVKIPVVLRAESFINRMSESQLDNTEHWSYQALISVYKCINCGKCIEKCPYNLNIPELIKENEEIIDKYYKK